MPSGVPIATLLGGEANQLTINRMVLRFGNQVSIDLRTGDLALLRDAY